MRRRDVIFVVLGVVFFVGVLITTGYLIAHPPYPAKSPAVVVSH